MSLHHFLLTNCMLRHCGLQWDHGQDVWEHSNLEAALLLLGLLFVCVTSRDEARLRRPLLTTKGTRGRRRWLLLGRQAGMCRTNVRWHTLVRDDIIVRPLLGRVGHKGLGRGGVFAWRRWAQTATCH